MNQEQPEAKKQDDRGILSRHKNSYLEDRKEQNAERKKLNKISINIREGSEPITLANFYIKITPAGEKEVKRIMRDYGFNENTLLKFLQNDKSLKDLIP